MLKKLPSDLPEMTTKQEDLCIQFVMDKQNGFLPLNMAIEAISITLKCSTVTAMQVYKFLNQ